MFTLYKAQEPLKVEGYSLCEYVAKITVNLLKCKVNRYLVVIIGIWKTLLGVGSTEQRFFSNGIYISSVEYEENECHSIQRA